MTFYDTQPAKLGSAPFHGWHFGRLSRESIHRAAHAPLSALDHTRTHVSGAIQPNKPAVVPPSRAGWAYASRRPAEKLKGEPQTKSGVGRPLPRDARGKRAQRVQLSGAEQGQSVDGPRFPVEFSPRKKGSRRGHKPARKKKRRPEQARAIRERAMDRWAGEPPGRSSRQLVPPTPSDPIRGVDLTLRAPPFLVPCPTCRPEPSRTPAAPSLALY